jgi:glycosyltransferase involved in cell wall biosynthesis
VSTQGELIPNHRFGGRDRRRQNDNIPARNPDESSRRRLGACHIISSFYPVTGGAQMATRRLCERLAGLGVDTVVLTRRMPGLPAREQVGRVSIFRAGHPSNSKLGAATFLLHGLWLLQTTLRSYPLLHVQNLDSPLILAFFARLLLRRTVYVTSHGQRRIVAAAQRRWTPLRIRLMRRLVHRFTALSPDMHRQLVDLGVPTARITLIPNGVDTEVYGPAPEGEKHGVRDLLDLRRTAVVGVFVGRLVPLKRVDLLLRAWSEGSEGADAQLVIIGDGPERLDLERLSRDLGNASVRFVGETERVVDYLKAADIFILPSEHEGLSVALLEAMASGLAPLVTDLPGNRLLVRHQVSGIVIPINDLRAFHVQLRRLLTDHECRRRLGQAARETAVAGYSLSFVAQRHLELYRADANAGGTK